MYIHMYDQRVSAKTLHFYECIEQIVNEWSKVEWYGCIRNIRRTNLTGRGGGVGGWRWKRMWEEEGGGAPVARASIVFGPPSVAPLHENAAHIRTEGWPHLQPLWAKRLQTHGFACFYHASQQSQQRLSNFICYSCTSQLFLQWAILRYIQIICTYIYIKYVCISIHTHWNNDKSYVTKITFFVAFQS